MNVSVIIPTLNAERWLERQIEALLNQTVKAEILVIDSSSTDGTAEIAERYTDQVQLIQISKNRFDHGGTRDFALRQTNGDFVLFLTQDAVPTNDRYIENLLSAFSDENVAAAFGKQIAWPDSPEYEKLTRLFNYPETGRVWCEEDIAHYDVKSYFFSNASSAFRRSTYEAVGGFDVPISSNEDMMMAAKLLHAGYSLAYQPEATVWHSHKHSLVEEYRRYFRIGKVMEQFNARLTGTNEGNEGLRMVRFVSAKLLKRGNIIQLFIFLTHAAFRFFGFRTGKKRAKHAGDNDKTAHK